MSRARRPLSRAARPRGARLLALAVLAAAAHMSGVGNAAPPVPVPGHVSIGVTGQGDVPGANNPDLIVVRAPDTFTVTIAFATDGVAPAPVTFNRDSVVTVSLVGGSSLGTVVVPAGESSAQAVMSIQSAGNGVVLHADVTGGSRDAKALADGFTAPFDVLIQADRSTDGGPAFLTTDRTTTGCVPDTVNPYCADVSLPFGTTGGYLVSVGLCDGVCPGAHSGRRVVQLLAGLEPQADGRPGATIVFKCDKSKCKGGGVSSYTPLVNLEPSGALAPAPGCNAKGVVIGQDYCVDYVQSKRDGAGDLHMYVLFAIDVRGSCC